MTGPQPHQNAGPSDSAAWAHAVNMLLGLWLIAAPPTFGVSTPALIWSDVVSGALVVALSALALRRSWAAWAACGVGLWLMGAPLLFWARSAAVYNDDTLIGALVVTFAVIVPRFGRDDAGGMPPGWSYNPSAWAQRVPIAFLAMLGFFLSRYMAAFQLGHIAYPWDPFFGDGTRTVLTSDIARSFPVSDAGLGALSYLLDALAGLLGDQRRWRTMPWMVLLFGFFIIPPGVTSIVLVILQPVAVGAWCTLCLVGAVITLILVPPALDEVVATGQFLLRTRREGRSLWRAFWQGEGSTQEAVQPVRPSSGFGELLHGIEILSAPWNLLASALVGVWLMAAPSLLGTSGAAANNEYIMGALVATFAVVAIAEPARVVRLLNVMCGLWLIAAPWLLAGGTPASRWSDVAAGFALIVLSLRRGRLEDRYGGWERWIV